jgi:ATP-binding cassette, subfamily C (CFTR/MRP), member 1
MNGQLGFTDIGSRALNSSASTGDNTFGPFIEFSDRATFDFTLLFEETILSILPSALLLLLIPARILRLRKTLRKVTGSYLQTIKIVGFPNIYRAAGS